MASLHIKNSMIAHTGEHDHARHFSLMYIEWTVRTDAPYCSLLKTEGKLVLKGRIGRVTCLFACGDDKTVALVTAL